MNSRKRKRRFDSALAAEFGPDDGIDPRDWRKGDEPRTVRNRMALQLCAQVERALHLSLAGLADPVLQELVLLHVRPCPDSSRLLVTVRTAADPVKVQAHLVTAAARLRADVATAIYRRKTPELIFRVVPADK